MLRVGLTGGMGSGKSMVAARLAQCGASIIDSDRIAREVVRPGTDGLRAVIGEFGEADPRHGRRHWTDRRWRGGSSATRKLEPGSMPSCTRWSRPAPLELVAAAPAEAIVVQDIPLLVEVGMAAGFPWSIVVHADAAVRLRRLVEQRGMAESDAAAQTRCPSHCRAAPRRRGHLVGQRRQPGRRPSRQSTGCGPAAGALRDKPAPPSPGGARLRSGRGRAGRQLATAGASG